MRPMSVLLTGLIICVFTSSIAASDTIPKPPDPEMATKIDWIWENKIKSWTTSERNTCIDQLFADAAMGTFRVCVRWDSESTISPTKRDEIENMLSRHMGMWTSCLKGFDGWPWDTVLVKVSGWAVVNRSTLDWADGDTPAPIYVNVLDANSPSCDRDCSRAAHQSHDYTYPDCDGGAENHWDWYSWHKQGVGFTGFGSPAGQQTDADMTLDNTNGLLHIILHEMGHSFTLPDFYDDDVPGGDPVCVMNAGSSMNITEYDVWMLRRIWSEIKRTPGRLPDITKTTVTQVARTANRFSVFTKNGLLQISTNRPVSSAQVKVYDLSGRVVMSGTLSINTVSTIEGGSGKRFGSGMYLVSISVNSRREVHRINIAK